MVKILIVSPLALENGRGGEISSMELAAGLNKYFKTSFVHTNIFIGKRLLSKRAIADKLNGVKIRTRMKFATINISNLVFTFPYPWNLIKFYRIVKKNDIIYTSCSTFKQNIIFMLFSLLLRRGRYIIGYRKPLYSDKLFSLYNTKYRLSILFFSLFKKRFYHHALSKSAKHFLDKFYDPEKVIHIIHGINLEKYSKNNVEKERKDLIKFCYIGHIDDIHKGVGVLLKGIEILLEKEKDLKLFFEFCGTGPLSSKVINLENRFPAFIKYYGYISNDKIHHYYKSNDVFLFSSRREPFPRAIMEALAAKLIVISSKTIGSIELLQGKKFSFFIDELTPEAIKEKILEVYNLWKQNQSKFRELQNLAKEFVFQNYSSLKEIESFKSLIEKIW